MKCRPSQSPLTLSLAVCLALISLPGCSPQPGPIPNSPASSLPSPSAPDSEPNQPTEPSPSSLPSPEPDLTLGEWTPLTSGFVDQPVASVLTPSNFVTPVTPLSVSGNGSLKLVRNYVKPGKPIIINFATGNDFKPTAWIGLVPSAVTHGNESFNDLHDIARQNLGNKSIGQLSFNSPTSEGNYDLRMFDGDGNEAASISFVVSRELSPSERGQSKLWLNNQFVRPGQPIVLRLTAPSSFEPSAWVGVVPSEISHGEEYLNDQHDLSWKYLEGLTSGELSFNAPATAGNYDFRLHDANNGKEVCYASFTVTRELPQADVAASFLKLERFSYRPGESIQMSFGAASSYAATGWIGMLPASLPHGEPAANDQQALAKKSLAGKTAGSFTYTAPSQPGTYDLRLHDQTGNGTEIGYIRFQVTE
ncbi:MAG: hypothetical protein CVV27_11895 [Candidatus Melainabacteria bacterium HGW-Melainabacteria-1]|nr:MAG: hypothetical protein CVV27_11895 [Candidatus Melainabacteria bacterium HGW-Melainabacteria-1]